MQRVVDIVNTLEADAVVLTGDIVDGHFLQLKVVMEPLQELKSKHGVFFVTGNREQTHPLLPIPHLFSLPITMNVFLCFSHTNPRLVFSPVFALPCSPPLFRQTSTFTHPWRPRWRG